MWLIYSRCHKNVSVPYSFYDSKMLSPVKRYDPITGANRNYGSLDYSVIAWFLWVNIPSSLVPLIQMSVLIALNVLSHHGVLVTHYKTESSDVFLDIVIGTENFQLVCHQTKCFTYRPYYDLKVTV